MLFGLSDGFGSDLGAVTRGNKKAPKRSKTVHYRAKVGVENYFSKNHPEAQGSRNKVQQSTLSGLMCKIKPTTANYNPTSPSQSPAAGVFESPYQVTYPASQGPYPTAKTFPGLGIFSRVRNYMVG